MKFKKAVFEAKKHYLSIFFERIEVSDKKIQKVVYSPLFQNLLDTEKVTLSTTLLEDRNVNITSPFVHVFKVFEDFRFISQLREEMDKVRPAVAIVPS